MFCVRLEHTLEANERTNKRKKKWGDRQCESKREREGALARANGKLNAENVVQKRQRINEKMLRYEMFERSTWKQQRVVAPIAADDVQ